MRHFFSNAHSVGISPRGVFYVRGGAIHPTLTVRRAYCPLPSAYFPAATGCRLRRAGLLSLMRHTTSIASSTIFELILLVPTLRS